MAVLRLTTKSNFLGWLGAFEDLVDVSGVSTGEFSSSGFIQNVFKPKCCYHDDLRSHSG